MQDPWFKNDSAQSVQTYNHLNYRFLFTASIISLVQVFQNVSLSMRRHNASYLYI